MTPPALFAEIEGCVPFKYLSLVEQIYVNTVNSSSRRDEFCLFDTFSCGEALVAKAFQGCESIGAIINDNPADRAAYLWDFVIKTLSGIYYAITSCRTPAEREFKKNIGAMVIELTEFGGKYLNDTFNPAKPSREPSLFD